MDLEIWERDNFCLFSIFMSFLAVFWTRRSYLLELKREGGAGRGSAPLTDPLVNIGIAHVLASGYMMQDFRVLVCNCNNVVVQNTVVWRTLIHLWRTLIHLLSHQLVLNLPWARNMLSFGVQTFNSLQKVVTIWCGLNLFVAGSKYVRVRYTLNVFAFLCCMSVGTWFV